MDGTIVIGTDLKTNKFEQKLQKLEQKYKDEEIDLNLKFGNLEDAKKELEEANKELAKIQKKKEDINKTVASKQKQYDALNLKLNSSEPLTSEEYNRYGFLENALSKAKQQQEELNNEAEKYNQAVNKATEKLTIAEGKYQKQKQKVEETKTEIIRTNNEIEKMKIDKIKEGFDGVGNSVKKVTKNISKWALAIFGIRSAYNFVRSAISTISSYDDQIKTDVEYIRYALASAVKPVVEVLIKMAFQLLSVINAVSKALFNYDLFSGATAENFKKTSGYANDIKKSLAGFDEMNILGDTSSGGGGGVSDISPSVDLSKINTDVEKIGEQIKTVVDETTSFWEEEWADTFFTFENEWGIAWAGIGLTLEGFYNVFKGIVDVVSGVWDILQGIFTGNEEQIQQGIENLKKGIWEIIVGLVEIIIGLIHTAVGIIFGILVNIVKFLWDNVLLPIWDGIKFVIDMIITAITYLITIISGIFTTLVEIVKVPFEVLWNTAQEVFKGIRKTVQGVFDVIKGLFTGDWKLVMEGFKKIFKSTFDSLWAIAKTPINLIIGGINALIKGLNKLQFDVPDWVPLIGGKTWGFNIPEIPKLAKGGIVNLPGRGVPVGNAITGERGAEGVIPLTDSQQMMLLGEAIGKYITINASITNTMNGRVISRELQRIQNESDFAFNR